MMDESPISVINWLALRVEYDDEASQAKRITTVLFDKTAPVSDALFRISKRNLGIPPEEIGSYALYLPAFTKNGFHLPNDRSLSSFGLNNQDIVIFRKLHTLEITSETRISSDETKSLKVVVTGDQCGKSQLCSRLVHDTFEDKDDPTVEDEYTKIFDGFHKGARLDILDTSGDDSYADLKKKWYEWAEGIVCVFSVASVTTFDAVPRFLSSVAQSKGSLKFPLVIVGTQADIEKREVTTKEALSVAYRYQCPYFEVSAKTGENVQDPFLEIRRAILETVRSRASSTSNLNDSPGKIARKKSISFRPSGNRGSLGIQVENSTSTSIQLGPKDKLGELKDAKKRKKIHLLLKDDSLMFFKSLKNVEENKTEDVVSLLTCTIKPATMKPKENTFKLITAAKTWEISAENETEMKNWIQAVQDGILSALSKITSEKEKSVAGGKSPEEEWRAIQRISAANMLCVDCSSPDPDWVSINLGVLMCIQCSGIHRSMGVHVTKVRSLTLDKLDGEIYQLIKSMGNSMNSVYEAKIPPGVSKPGAKDERFKKENFIRAKYVDRKFFAAPSSPNAGKEVWEALGKDDISGATAAMATFRDFNWKNPESFDQSFLHMVCEKDQILSSIWLVMNDVHLDTFDRRDMSPLDVCKKFNRIFIENWLRKKGATSLKLKDIAEADQVEELDPVQVETQVENVAPVQVENQVENLAERQRRVTNADLVQEILKTSELGIPNSEQRLNLLLATQVQNESENDLHKRLWENAFSSLDYFQVGILEALRRFLESSDIPTTLNKAMLMIQIWSEKYFDQNPNLFPDKEFVEKFVWQLILLHFNIHVDSNIPIDAGERRTIDKISFCQTLFKLKTFDDSLRNLVEGCFTDVTLHPFKCRDILKHALMYRYKKGNLFKLNKKKRWDKRWFVLNKDNLKYYKSQKETDGMVELPLEDALVGRSRSSGKGYVIQIDVSEMNRSKDGHPDGRYLIAAADQFEYNDWMESISINIHLQKLYHLFD